MTMNFTAPGSLQAWCGAAPSLIRPRHHDLRPFTGTFEPMPVAIWSTGLRRKDAGTNGLILVA